MINQSRKRNESKKAANQRDFFLVFSLFALVSFPALNPLTLQAATINASSCSSANVQTAVNSAAAGDTVQIPAGSCSWTGVTLAKAITLQGAGQGATTIDVSGGNPAFTITKQSSGSTRIQNFTFTASNNNNLPHPIVVQGSWPAAQPVIFQNDTFTLNAATMIDVTVAGGVIFSHITFNGGWNDFFMTVKDLSDANSWTTADSLGTHDTTGLLMIYVEDSVFNGGSNGVFDCDDN